jgi:hypothetical protein
MSAILNIIKARMQPKVIHNDTWLITILSTIVIILSSAFFGYSLYSFLTMETISTQITPTYSEGCQGASTVVVSEKVQLSFPGPNAYLTDCTWQYELAMSKDCPNLEQTNVNIVLLQDYSSSTCISTNYSRYIELHGSLNTGYKNMLTCKFIQQSITTCGSLSVISSILQNNQICDFDNIGGR